MNNPTEIKRGQVYKILSGYGDQTKTKFAVIVSADALNRMSESYQVVYLTTNPSADLATHANTRVTGTPSVAVCEKIYTVYPDALDECVGALNDTEMNMLDACLAIAFGITKPMQSCPMHEEPVAKVDPDEYEPDFDMDALTQDEDEDDMAEEALELYTDLVRTTAERDVYKNLYHELLVKLTNK